MNVVKIAEKFLMRDVYEFDGFKYKFYKIISNKDFIDSLIFFVKVTLPDPDQSYISEVFFKKSEEIIDSFFNFLGKNYSYNLSVQIGDDDKDYENYIRPELVEKIINLTNKEFNYVGLDIGNMNFKFNLDFEPSHKRDFYSGEAEELNFYFDLNLSNLQLNNEFVKIKEGLEGTVAQNLLDTIHDRDWFYSKLEDIIFNIIQPETQIADYEIYLGAILEIKSIDGKNVEKYGYKELSKDDFISLKSSQ